MHFGSLDPELIQIKFHDRIPYLFMSSEVITSMIHLFLWFCCRNVLMPKNSRRPGTAGPQNPRRVALARTSATEGGWR